MRKYTTVLAIVVAVAGVALAARPKRAAPVQQPIAFNHKVHAETAGLTCTEFCHSYAPTSQFAGIPGKDVCLNCHDAPEDSDKAELRKLAEYADSAGDIPWVRLTGTRPDVYFSHRRHVVFGKLECTDCHADMPKRESPPDTRLPMIRMDTCIDCHDRHSAAIDCIACHR